LKAGRLEESTDLYQEAFELLENSVQDITVNKRHDWICKLEDEAGKVQSNLSLIFLRRKEPEKALLHADKACSFKPKWSKPHCRRALALEVLGRLEEAEAAIERTIEAVDKLHENCNRDEYEEIHCRIQAAIDSRGNTAVDISFQSLRIDSEDIFETDSIFGLFGQPVISDLIVGYLCPADVAKLEMTCGYFTSQPEKLRRRRIALSSPLLSLKSEVALEYIQIFCNKRLHDDHAALSEILANVFAITPSRSSTSLPKWLKKMDDRSRAIIESICMDSGSNDIQRQLCILVYQWFFTENTAEFDPSEVPSVYWHDRDSELLRLTTCLQPFVDKGDVRAAEMQQKTYLYLANMILVHGMHMDGAEAFMPYFLDLTDLVGINVPIQWPGSQGVLDSLELYEGGQYEGLVIRRSSGIPQLESGVQEAYRVAAAGRKGKHRARVRLASPVNLAARHFSRRRPDAIESVRAERLFNEESHRVRRVRLINQGPRHGTRLRCAHQRILFSPATLQHRIP